MNNLRHLFHFGTNWIHEADYNAAESARAELMAILWEFDALDRECSRLAEFKGSLGPNTPKLTKDAYREQYRFFAWRKQANWVRARAILYKV